MASERPVVVTDFNKTGGGRLEFTAATVSELEERGIRLAEGLEIVARDHDAAADGTPLWIEADATVFYDRRRRVWGAWYDFDAVRSVERLD